MGIPKAGIPRVRIPKTRIPKADSPRDRESKAQCHAEGGATKGGVSKCEQTQANADKRGQTQANAEAQTQANASKREQTWTNANKRLHPPLLGFFTPPFAIPLKARDWESRMGGFQEGGCRNSWRAVCSLRGNLSLQETSYQKNRRRTNVQQLTCKIDLSNFFYYLFFSFVLLELKPFVLKGKVLGEKF